MSAVASVRRVPGFAVLLRSAVAAVVATGLISLLPVGAARFLGEWCAAHAPRRLPGAAVESLAGVSAPESHGYLPWPAATVCAVAWVAAACAVAALRLPHIDVH